MHERNITTQYSPDLEALTRKKRVCAYARVSSDRDEAFHSLSAQIGYYQKTIAEHGDWEYAGVFSDRGITGTKEERPGFQAMLEACREKKVDIVLAKSITRFARNTVVLLNTVRELRSLGIDIYFEEERIHTLSAQGELMISLLAARAQEESRSASENQKWRIKKCYEKGIPVTGNCLGYRMVDHQFLIDEEEEQVVLRIFSMYLSGMGKTAIAKKLTDEGVKNRFGEVHWSKSTIADIIRNEKYCGDLKLQKSFVTDYISKKKIANNGEREQYYVKNAHDPIIPRQEYERVQQEIKRRTKNKGKKPMRSLFTSMITCQICGKHFVRKRNHAGTKHSKIIWTCTTSNEYGTGICKMGQAIPEEILIQKTKEVLGCDNLNESIIHENLQKIIVPDRNTLLYVFRNGTEKRVDWQHRSRRESWTPEMKEVARHRAILYNKAKQEGKNA